MQAAFSPPRRSQILLPSQTRARHSIDCDSPAGHATTTRPVARGSNVYPLASEADPDEPTRQLTLQDEDFVYDVLGNPVEIRDWRDPSDWPDGAKPVTKKIKYDDLYRAVDIRYEYADGDDTWQSPFASEVDANVNNDDPRRARPSPHVSFAKRILRQSFEYDWLGNTKETSDDAGGFYDRSLGTVQNDTNASRRYRMTSAALGAGAGVASAGNIEVRYDAAGYMSGFTVSRSGACLQAGPVISGSCTQRFAYQWDEVGRLVRALRWDGVQGGTNGVDTPYPPFGTVFDSRYWYDASDQRVIKQAFDAGTQRIFTAYVFESLELRRTTFGSDFAVNSWTVVPYLLANGVRLARVVHDPDADPTPGQSTGQPGFVSQSTAAGGNLYVFFELGDHLGSTSAVLDKATGELVERGTFQAYGGTESDYRPERWKSFREDYRFTGKEEDTEVGLQYFGKRYLNPLLGRWISADPLAVHAPGQADLNLYAYVRGGVLKSVDPLGLRDEAAAGAGRAAGEAGYAASKYAGPSEAVASTPASAAALAKAPSNTENYFKENALRLEFALRHAEEDRAAALTNGASTEQADAIYQAGANKAVRMAARALGVDPEVPAYYSPELDAEGAHIADYDSDLSPTGTTHIEVGKGGLKDGKQLLITVFHESVHRVQYESDNAGGHRRGHELEYNAGSSVNEIQAYRAERELAKVIGLKPEHMESSRVEHDKEIRNLQKEPEYLERVNGQLRIPEPLDHPFRQHVITDSDAM